MGTRRIVTVDIGGTNARFAIAELAGGRVAGVGAPVKLHTADHASLETAWAAFAGQAGGALPDEAAMSVAGPTGGAVLRFTNNPWVIAPAELPGRLGLRRLTLVNDFGAVGHAVAQVGGDQLAPVCGPAGPLPAAGVISVVGPGTGLGVAAVARGPNGYRVLETEGGHVAFSPIDAVEDALLARLRARHGHVSAERVVSGPGLAAIHETLAAVEGRQLPAAAVDDAALWGAALAGTDPLAVAALDRFCLALGSFAGDAALIHGAVAVVVAGGVGLRLRDHLPRSGFAGRFCAKGRFQGRLAGLPVRLITYPEPGLFGAAAAHALAYPDG